jgi:hypothetical protein
MPDALTILLFVAIGEGSEATTRAMVRATREALGPGAKVEVRESPTVPTEDEALIAEQLAGAGAVVELTWSDAAHRSAMLRVHVARSGRWIGRSIGFMPSDASTERGRTIGFAVVSMLPEAVSQTPPSTEPTPPPAPSAEPPEPPSQPKTPEPDRSLPMAVATPLPRVPPVEPSFALDVFALGAWGVGGEGADGGGGGVAAYWFPVAPFSIRVGGSLRAGSLGSVESSSTLNAAVSVGVGWHPLRATRSHPLGVSLRIDYVALYQSLRSAVYVVSTGGRATASADRWLSGLGTVVDFSWLLFTDIEAIAGLGFEEAFYSTNVQLQGETKPAADFPPLRAIGEAGLRMRF